MFFGELNRPRASQKPVEDPGVMAALRSRIEADERDREAVKDMCHEEQRAYFTRMLLATDRPHYRLTTAFNEWYDRDTQLTIENARWSAWERICNEGREASCAA